MARPDSSNGLDHLPMAKIAVSAANTAAKSAQVNPLEERTMVAISDPQVDG
ncbi:hypothetical protein [Hydrogenophaga sp.]|uniref:hypothetical protein n=1 Tax=Hydrogenophaga sp. TaxID=1904254 RepID=UPI002FC622AE